MVYLLYCLKMCHVFFFFLTTVLSHYGQSDMERLREYVDIWDKDYRVIINVPCCRCRRRHHCCCCCCWLCLQIQALVAGLRPLTLATQLAADLTPVTAEIHVDYDGGLK